MQSETGQRDLIDHAASLLGKSRSDFMLEAACDRAQAVVLDPVFFSLDADMYRQFTATLDAPPGPNPGLERLMALAVNRAVMVSQNAGVRALLVHALHDRAKGFCEHDGFQATPLHSMTLMLRLNSVKA